MLIEYFHSMGKEEKSFKTFEEDDIPENILAILKTNDAFVDSKIFGKKGIGSPEEIEQLNIILDDGSRKEFKYFINLYIMRLLAEKKKDLYFKYLPIL